MTLRPPHFNETKYLITTGDETEAKLITISISGELKPYISILPSESFEMQPHSMKDVLLHTNYTGKKQISGMISVTASPIGAGGGGGAVISIRLDKPVIIEAYNESVPFTPPELLPEAPPNATPAGGTPAAPAVPAPGAPYRPSQYETQLTVEPWVIAVGVVVLAAIGFYAYRLLNKRGK